MKRLIEVKRVGAKAHVRDLIDGLIDRLEEKLQHFNADAMSVHAVFDENAAHRLYRIALTCHVPGRTVAAHEESHDAGSTIRAAFAEVQRQLDKHKAVLRQERMHKRLRAAKA